MSRNLLMSFFSDEKGTETVEWGLMVAVIAGGLILIVGTIGSWIEDAFEHLRDDLAE